MRSCIAAVVLGLLLSGPASAAPRAKVVAALVSQGKTNHLYSVTDGATGRQLAIAYYAVASNISPRTKVRLKEGEVAVCPSVGVYEGCYHFPSMETALDWIRREVR